MTAIRMITQKEMFENLSVREQNKEIVKIHLKKEDGEDYVNSYYVGIGQKDFFMDDQTSTTTLAELTTAFLIDAPDRTLDGVAILIWLNDKEMIMWIKEKPEYFYKILEIITPKKGNSILKVEDLHHKGKVFNMKIPGNWEILNDGLGLIRDG